MEAEKGRFSVRPVRLRHGSSAGEHLRTWTQARTRTSGASPSPQAAIRQASARRDGRDHQTEQT